MEEEFQAALDRMASRQKKRCSSTATADVGVALLAPDLDFFRHDALSQLPADGMPKTAFRTPADPAALGDVRPHMIVGDEDATIEENEAFGAALARLASRQCRGSTVASVQDPSNEAVNIQTADLAEQAEFEAAIDRLGIKQRRGSTVSSALESDVQLHSQTPRGAETPPGPPRLPPMSQRSALQTSTAPTVTSTLERVSWNIVVPPEAAPGWVFNLGTTGGSDRQFVVPPGIHTGDVFAAHDGSASTATNANDAAT